MESVDYLRELTALAEHRGSAGEQERQAACWLRARLRDMGYTAAEQPFRTTKDNLYLVPVQVFSLAIAAASLALFTAFAWLALASLVYGLAILLVEVSGYPLEVSLLPRFPSRNVHAEPRERAARTLYVTAHYDTQRGSFLFHPRFVDRLPLLFHFCYTGLVLVLAGVLMNCLGLATGRAWLLRAGLLISVFAWVIFLLAQITGRYTPGANDNGTGTALALYLAQDYAQRPSDYPAGCSLCFLFTGSEEAGEKGMKAFLRGRGRALDKRHTQFLNLDNLGAGQLTYLTGEGMIFYRKAGPTLVRIAGEMRDQIQAQAPGREVLEQNNLLLPTDALPASALGYQAISFLGEDHKGRLGNYHYHTDTFENVDQEFLRFQQEFFKQYVKRAMSALEQMP